jgi:membrane-associated protein
MAATPAAAAAAAGPGGPLGFLKRALHFVLHLDKELVDIVGRYGRTTYAILWGIVFCETGLVVTPFLPGDSLLFACGALAALNVRFPLAPDHHMHHH